MADDSSLVQPAGVVEVPTEPPAAAFISILAADLSDPADENQVRGLFKRSVDIRYARIQLSAETLRQNLDAFFSAIGGVVADLPHGVGSYSVDTVTLAVEISAKGTVSLLGTGGELAGKGGITFTLKKPPAG